MWINQHHQAAEEHVGSGSLGEFSVSLSRICSLGTLIYTYKLSRHILVSKWRQNWMNDVGCGYEELGRRLCSAGHMQTGRARELSWTRDETHTAVAAIPAVFRFATQSPGTLSLHSRSKLLHACPPFSVSKSHTALAIGMASPWVVKMWGVPYKQFYIGQSCWGLWDYTSKHGNILPSVLQTSPGICQQPLLETKYETRWICWLISSASLKPAAHNGNIKGLNKSYFNKMKMLLQAAVAPASLLLPTALLSQRLWKLLTGFTARPRQVGLSHQWRWQ